MFESGEDRSNIRIPLLSIGEACTEHADIPLLSIGIPLLSIGILLLSIGIPLLSIGEACTEHADIRTRAHPHTRMHALKHMYTYALACMR